MTHVTLTEAQRRHIGIALDMLMHETRERLQWWKQVGRSDPEAEILQHALEDLLREAEQMADVLDVRLERPERDPHRELSAWASIWWARILDARPAALSRYGAVGDAAAEAIGPIVERLSARLMRLKTLSERRGERGA